MIIRYSFLGALILFYSVVCHAQVSDERARTIAVTATHKFCNYPESHLLRAHRREDLEDDFFRLQIKQQGRIEKGAYFYEVSGEGYFVLSPNEAVYVDEADGHVLRLVAVSVRNGEAYLLSGFKDAALEFNRLAKDASLRINSPKDAALYSRLCFTAIADPLADRVIYSSRQLRHKVEDYFFSNYPEKKAESLYQKWWSNLLSNKLKIPFDPLISENPLGYEITLVAINASPKRTPFIETWTLQISPEGICQIKNVRKIYPINA